MKPTPQWKIERLQDWLAEWRTDCMLIEAGGQADETGHRDTSESTVPPDAAAPFDPDVHAGEIRLLAPALPGAYERPRYVLVLEEPGTGSFRACPFSRFETPAVPGELLTGMQPAPLKVLCLWCCREIAEADLARSWRVETVDEQDLRLFRSAAAGVAREGRLPDELAERGGAPLVHPLDPRHDYLDEQSLWAEDACSGREGDREDARPIIYPFRERVDLPLAADEHDDYETE